MRANYAEDTEFIVSSLVARHANIANVFVVFGFAIALIGLMLGFLLFAPPYRVFAIIAAIVLGALSYAIGTIINGQALLLESRIEAVRSVALLGEIRDLLAKNSKP
jgi:hypothetical protein